MGGHFQCDILSLGKLVGAYVLVAMDINLNVSTWLAEIIGGGLRINHFVGRSP